MRVYTAITATIYKKSLTLSSSGRNEYTAGEVVNLMAVDAEKVKESVKFITFIWSAPLQVGLTIYFIWQIIGPSVLVGSNYNLSYVSPFSNCVGRPCCASPLLASEWVRLVRYGGIPEKTNETEGYSGKHG